MLLLALPLLFNASLLIREQLHQHAMEEKMEEAALQTLRIPEWAVQWTRAGKELRINGRLFDVKRHAYADGLLTLTGLFDEEEEQIKKTISESQHADKPLAYPRIVLLANLLTPALPLLNSLPPDFQEPIQSGTVFSPGRENDLPQRDFPIPTPPPRFL
jgi:hypothetical protein